MGHPSPTQAVPAGRASSVGGVLLLMPGEVGDVAGRSLQMAQGCLQQGEAAAAG